MVIITKQEHLCQYGLDVWLIKIDEDIRNMEYSKQIKYFETILKDKIKFEKYTIDINTQDYVNNLFVINVWDDKDD
jgi:hypothetical protein